MPIIWSSLRGRQRSLARGSNIGLLATNRNLGNENAGSIGFDTTTYFTETLSFNGQILRVHGPTADGGFVWYMRPSYDTSTTHFHVPPGIRDDFNVLGFIQDDDRKEFDTNLSHIFFFDTGLLERVRPVVNYNRYTSFDQGVLRGWALAPAVAAQLRNGLEFEIARRDEYRLFEKGFRNHQRPSQPAGTAARGARSPPISATASISTTILSSMGEKRAGPSATAGGCPTV